MLQCIERFLLFCQNQNSRSLNAIRAKSYITLNKVAMLLVNKNFSLKLAGHADK
jgi:hypothetical protein